MGMVAIVILENMVKGKKVIIVGPSPHLMGKNLGEYIDSHDIVCRVNNLPSIDLKSDYGSKTDILFHNCASTFLDYFKTQMLEDDRYKKIKLVYCPVLKSVGSDNIANIVRLGVSPVANNFPKINVYNLPFEAIDTNTYAKYYMAMQAEPNCGMMAIVLLLGSLVDSLFITGFSFYAQGIEAKNSYIPGHRYIIDGYDSSTTGEASHPQKPQINFFKNYVLSRYNNKIMVDSYLNDILGLSHSKVLVIT